MEERRNDYPEILKSIDEIKSDVKDIKKVINGDGKLGLFAKVELMWRVGLFIVITIIGILIKLFVK